MKQLNLIVFFCYLSFSLAAQSGRWTWVSGDNVVDQAGIYGTKGIPAAANKPGSRENGVSWKDAANNLWMFGGTGNDGTLNDLWRYNTSSGQWTWMSGDNTTRVNGVYGTKGSASTGNKPGSRYGSISWTDASGNFWLFGGYGSANATVPAGYLNDLWKYNPASNQWTWISGDNATNRTGSYGIMGVPNVNNNPGGRYLSVSWMDASGNLWLFGGIGRDADQYGALNDLWKFNPSTLQWTWITGDRFVNRQGVYGTKGVPAPANKPGSRESSVSWIDASGNFWLFGGSGPTNTNGTGSYVYFNDLWKYNPATNQWTWTSGDATSGQTGVYGTKGVPAAANKPGARESAVSWIDGSGNLMLFGGSIPNIQNTATFFNDLWKYSPSSNQWTWASGDNTLDRTGIYGTKGIPSSSNKPGARDNAIGWLDASGFLWMFGGSNNRGFDGDALRSKVFNDLWKFDQTTLSCPSPISTITDLKSCSNIVKDIDPIITPAGQVPVNFSISGSTVASGSGSVSGRTFNQGISTVVYTLVSDPAQTCQFTVRMADSTKPVPVITPLPDITGECSVTVTTHPTATDNCDASPLIATTKDVLTYSQPGTYSITWTYSDKTGNTATQVQRVIVKSSLTNPVPTVNPLPDIIGACSATVTSKPTATQGCAGIVTGITNDPVTYNQQGIYTITWRYYGANESIVTQQQRVIVKDSLAPVPVVASLPDINAQCSVTITAKPTATDNCAASPLVGSTADALTYNKQGTYTISWSYSDGNNNITKQTQRVIVKDNIAPVPKIATLPDITAECSVTITDKPSATDNCNGTITATTTDSLSYTSQGSRTINWTYTDSSGNSSKQTQRVIVTPSSGKPSPTISPLSDIIGECSANVTVKPTASQNCAGIITGTTNDALSYTKQGIYTITWTYTGVNGSSITQTQRVIVKDITAPVPKSESLPDITGECLVTVSNRPSATDNCNGLITATTTDSLTYTTQGIRIITWTYTDSSGNSSKQSQLVIVSAGSGKPSPTNASLPDVTGECSATVTVKPTASQNCAGIITGTTNDPLSYTKQGTYSITWTYTGANGSSATQIQHVIVRDVTSPVPTSNILPDITGECSVTVSATPTSTDNCNGTIRATTTDSLSYATPGTRTVTWTYTDSSGNSSKQSQRVIVNPNSGLPSPTISPLPDIIGECSAIVTVKPTASQNCAGSITGTTNDPLSYTKQGSYIITWTYTNANGSASQTQRVIVKDVTPPVPALETLPDITGECSVTVSTTPTAIDNCNGVITATTTDPRSYNTQGTHTITWTYTDSTGNSSKQTQRVIVKPGSGLPVPTISILPDITGECSAIVTVRPTASENCAGTITGTTNEPLSYTKQGTYIITWTYTNVNGSVTQTQKVIVKDTTPAAPRSATLADITGECSLTVTTIPAALDNCAGTITATTKDPLVYNAQGTYNINWIFNDGNGNVSTQDQKVIIKDHTAPVPNAATLPDITGECLVQVSKKPTATDNCGGTISATTNDPIVYSEKGTYTLTWIFKDANGNSVTQTQRVIVKTVSLSLNVYPNPVSDHFNIIVRSCNRDKITLRVFDSFGRLLDIPNNVIVSGQPVSMGSSYPSGIYYAQVMQGDEKVTLKLVKIR